VGISAMLHVTSLDVVLADSLALIFDIFSTLSIKLRNLFRCSK
jgi:hypothetical protein